MLLYIFIKLCKNAIASDEKSDFVKEPVSHEHLKDSALYQVLYSIAVFCSKVHGLVSRNILVQR